MTFLNAFRPTKGKIVVIIILLIVPFLRGVMGSQIYFDFYDRLPFFLAEVLFYIALAVFLTGRFITLPFESFLRNNQLWEMSGIFTAPTGPTSFGLLLVVIFYAILIYIIWSLAAVVVGKDS